MDIKIKDLVKNNKVTFSRFRAGICYYSVSLNNETYQFPVPIKDIGNATLQSEDKAIFYMRYIKKALDDGTFVKV